MDVPYGLQHSETDFTVCFFSDNFLIISAVNHMKLVSGGPIFAHLKSGRVANNLKKFNGDIRTTSW